MSYYRDTYLKSEEWRSLRKEKILKDGFRCKLCGKRPPKNNRSSLRGFQVHHLDYKNLHDVETKDLRTLCPTCHLAVHTLMRKYPKMKSLPTAEQWRTVLYHLRPDRRADLSGMISGLDDSGKRCGQRSGSRFGAEIQFSKTRKILFESGKIYKNRMPWNDSFYECEKILDSLNNPDNLLSAYIESTQTDPRRVEVK